LTVSHSLLTHVWKYAMGRQKMCGSMLGVPMPTYMGHFQVTCPDSLQDVNSIASRFLWYIFPDVPGIPESPQDPLRGPEEQH
jgi:hypothetical protein